MLELGLQSRNPKFPSFQIYGKNTRNHLLLEPLHRLGPVQSRTGPRTPLYRPVHRTAAGGPVHRTAVAGQGWGQGGPGGTGAGGGAGEGGSRIGAAIEGW